MFDRRGSRLSVIVQLMKVVAEQTFDLSHAGQKVRARVYQPVLEPDGETWTCVMDVGDPFDVRMWRHGVSSFQALILALNLLSIELYASEEYKTKELGFRGSFGADLGIPATRQALDRAPYPF